jgi:hypothetical protein
MVWGAIIGGVLGLASGAASSASASSEARRARKAEQDRIDQQFKYDKQVDDFNWSTILRQYGYAQQEVGIARQNQEQLLGYQEASSIRDYKNQLSIRDFDYQNQMRQYAESERIYGLQLQFNNQAAGVAKEAEALRFQDILNGMAFDQQDMFVKMLQEEGQAQAAGVSGRSAKKVLGSVMASYGRNQAILAESLVSAKKATSMSQKQIDTEKYGADLAAESRRMLMPMKAPAPLPPLQLPRSVFLDPLEPMRGPKPMKGVNTVQVPSGLSISGLLNSTMSGISFGSQFDKR